MINELTRKNAHTELDHIFKTILPAHGMTERPEQIRLSHTMLDAMFENRIALSDAGTGIGKTYAYLTAAIVYSHSRLVDGLPFQPVIIATSSIALQNAIVREYLPFLSDALSDDPHITTPILAALRKGKSHYVCDERLRQHLQQRPNGKNVMQKKELYSLRDVLDLDETQKLSSFDRERVCVPQFCDCKHPDCRYRRHLTECGQKRYPYLTVSILNPAKGEIDSVRMKIGDVVSRSCRSTNPNLRNTEPHIWVDGKTPQWYACCPGSRDYTLLANATAEYLSVFELTHERVQNRAGKTTERRRAENVR